MQTGASVGTAASIYVKNAPSEGLNNYGLYIVSDNNKFTGNVDVNTLSINGTPFTASLTIINILAGITASSNDINILKDSTVNSTSFNY